MNASDYQVIADKFAGQISEFVGDQTVTIDSTHLVEAVEFVHSTLGYEMLATITAVDYGVEAEPRFHLFYRFTSISKHATFNMRVPVSGKTYHVKTVEGIYRNANWHEREVWDMFGIKFEGHSDPRRILMPFEWEGHPLRKDYPLGYEEPQFTFNYDEIDGRKPYAVRREE